MLPNEIIISRFVSFSSSCVRFYVCVLLLHMQKQMLFVWTFMGRSKFIITCETWFIFTS